MKKLTSRQEEYLFLFADRDGRGKGVSEAAEQFQVSKPTAFSISEALEKRGMIEKGNFGEIRLTEEGWSYIAPKLGYLNVLTEWLESDLGLAPVLAEQEARRMVVSLLPETVRAMAESRERRRTEGSGEEEQEDAVLSELDPGTYRVFFQVCRPGSRELSMGDLGFRKPALLQKGAEGSFLCSVRRISDTARRRNFICTVFSKDVVPYPGRLERGRGGRRRPAEDSGSGGAVPADR